MAINLSSVNVPNVYTQIIPPNPLLNGVPTDIIGLVGTATWGPVNSPVPVGSIQEYVRIFGTPLTNKYDMGTHLYFAGLQGGANYRCVRVTDGTDTASLGEVKEDTVESAIGAYLTSKYTGSAGNKLSAIVSKGTSSTISNPTYKLSVSVNGGFPETFDNIGGVGAQFWKNLVDAVNLGQTTGAGPSNLVIASLGTSVSDVTVTNAGLYTTIPSVTINTSTGSGALLKKNMKLLVASAISTGSGYAIGDTIHFSTQGTFTASSVIQVSSIGIGGAITSFTIPTSGSYSVLPTGTLTPTGTSGSGTGATFSFVDWGIESIDVVSGGTNYATTDTISIGGSGGGAATLFVGSSAAPASQLITFSGGTDGITGVDDQTILGQDFTSPRTGMYALRNAIAGGMLVLCDVTDPQTYSLQNLFSLEEYCYGIGAMNSGLQDNLIAAEAIVQNAGVDSSADKIAPFCATMGDWVYITDPFNKLSRFISPQSFKAGILSSILPSESALNKPLNGIIGTQKSIEGRTYSNADLSFLRSARIDVLTNPIPQGDQYGWRFGIDISSNPAIQTDNYVRMVNFLAATFQNGLGQYVGPPQTPELRLAAKGTLDSFLYNLYTLNMIGDVNNPSNPSAAFKVILDSSNNPPEAVSRGFMQADIQVVLFAIVQYFIVNVDAQQGISIQTFAQAS